jgi:Uma2 family endonuclease
MTIALPTHMTVDEFLAWAVGQEGRYELFDGRVVMQQSQTWGHARISQRIYDVLAASIRRAGVPYYAAPMGMTVPITNAYAFEPDALVAPLPEPRPADLTIPNPVVVIEVLSPSTTKRDWTDKLDGYFKVPSVRHYLIVDAAARAIAWHRRAADGGHTAPTPVREGSLRLDPPAIEFALADFFPSE